MKKPYFINQLLFLILFMVCPIAVSAETEISILYTNNTNGALENCLCPGKAYGRLRNVSYLFANGSRIIPILFF